MRSREKRIKKALQGLVQATRSKVQVQQARHQPSKLTWKKKKLTLVNLIQGKDEGIRKKALRAPRATREACAIDEISKTEAKNFVQYAHMALQKDQMGLVLQFDSNSTHLSLSCQFLSNLRLF